MGSVGRFLNRKRNYRQILRISRKKGRAPASNITREISQMSRLSKFAAGGSVIYAKGIKIGRKQYTYVFSGKIFERYLFR